MQRVRPSLRIAIGQDSGKRKVVENVEVSNKNAFGVKTHPDTMFVCKECRKAFNSHSPLADHIVKSTDHRDLTRREHFLAETDDDFSACFVCLCCCDVPPLTASQFFDHLTSPSHVHNSLDQVLTWYKNQIFGLSKDRDAIQARHHRGIRKLLDALNNVYYFDLK